MIKSRKLSQRLGWRRFRAAAAMIEAEERELEQMRMEGEQEELAAE
jgi:hypothetical protein